LFEFLHLNNQSTEQKLACVSIQLRPSQAYVLIIRSDSSVRDSSELIGSSAAGERRDTAGRRGF